MKPQAADQAVKPVVFEPVDAQLPFVHGSAAEVRVRTFSRDLHEAGVGRQVGYH